MTGWKDGGKLSLKTPASWNFQKAGLWKLVLDLDPKVESFEELFEMKKTTSKKVTVT